MRKFLFIALLALTFTACNNNVKLDKEQQLKQTTLEIQQMAQADTNYYKVVYPNDSQIVVVDKTNTVVADANVPSLGETFAVMVIGIIIGFAIGSVIFTDN